MRVAVYPVMLELEGAVVYINEVIETTDFFGKPYYLVSCEVEYKGYRSQMFQLDAHSEKELIEKLKVEIAKMKNMVLLGRTHIFSRVQ